MYTLSLSNVVEYKVAQNKNTQVQVPQSVLKWSPYMHALSNFPPLTKTPQSNLNVFLDSSFCCF